MVKAAKQCRFNDIADHFGWYRVRVTSVLPGQQSMSADEVGVAGSTGQGAEVAQVLQVLPMRGFVGDTVSV